MDWTTIEADFEFDGSWRDIYVPNAGVAEWEAVWERLFRLSPAPILNSADYSGPMPERFEWPGQTAHGRAHLGVMFGKIMFNCRFFDDHEIEFDFDPRKIGGPEEANQVAGFMALLGDATGRPVLLTWENAKQAVIARYEPGSSGVVWSPMSQSDH